MEQIFIRGIPWGRVFCVREMAHPSGDQADAVWTEDGSARVDGSCFLAKYFPANQSPASRIARRTPGVVPDRALVGSLEWHAPDEE